jgi:Prokaryotic ubiquitin-like protein UBact
VIRYNGTGSNPFKPSMVQFFNDPYDSLPFQLLLLDFFMPERIQKPAEPAPWGPKQGDGGGPRSPDVSRPDTKDLLKKMRKVDPNQSKRYRQRTGQ